MASRTDKDAPPEAASAPLETPGDEPQPDAQALAEAAAGERTAPLGAMTVPAEGAQLPGEPAKLTPDNLPEGYALVESEPKGLWSQLLDADGKPVKVGGKFVSTEGLSPTVAHPQ